MDLVTSNRLLNDFSVLGLSDERPQTFIEIYGHPRREITFSNALSFFLNPRKPHGLGTLMLKALFRSVNSPYTNERLSGEISVECEIPTNSGKRIDVLIQSDEYAILIENKIDARINNPFDEYAIYLDTIADSRQKHKILLTISPSSAGMREGFVNVTYTRLVDCIKVELGRHASQADTRLLTLFLDFLNTLDNLKRGTRMDPKLIEFLANRHDKLEELLVHIHGVKEEMKAKTHELSNLINITDHEGISQSFERPVEYLYDDLRYDIFVSEDLTVRVEASIFPMGWQIWIWSVSGDYDGLIDLGKLLEISADAYYKSGLLHRLSYDHLEHNEMLKYDEDISKVAEIVQELINKFATSREESR